MGVGWIDLADSDKWRNAVNTVINLRVPQQAEKPLEQLIDCWLVNEDSANS